MKKIFTLSIGLLWFALAFGQTVWASKGAIWQYRATTMLGTETITILRLNDEIKAQGKMVKQLKSISGSYTGFDFPTNAYIDTFYTYSEGDKVYLGRDTATLKVYYDFGAERFQPAGDHWADSIQSLSTCGGIRGYLAMRQGFCTPNTLKYGYCYERIGNLAWMFFPSLNDCIATESYPGLIHYQDSSGFEYNMGQGFSCSPVVTSLSFTSPAKNAIQLYPNPFVHTTTLKSNGFYKEVQYSVIDNVGQTVLQGQFEQEENITLAVPGLYHLLIMQNGKVIQSARVIKQ